MDQEERQKTHTKILNKLQQNQREQYCHKLMNFPHLPKNLKQGDQKAYQILAECFPWGCSRLVEKKPYFAEGDSCINIRVVDLSNIYIGIKYGICSTSIKNFPGIKRKFDKTQKLGKKSYGFISSGDNNIIALGQILQIKPDMTFRFWKRQNVYFNEQSNAQKNFGRSYSVGTITINYLAIGYVPCHLIEQVNYQPSRLNFAYEKLKQMSNQYQQHSIRWSFFEIADREQQKARIKYINMLKEGNLMKQWQEVQKKNKELLEMLLQAQKMDEEPFGRKDDDSDEVDVSFS